MHSVKTSAPRIHRAPPQVQGSSEGALREKRFQEYDQLVIHDRGATTAEELRTRVATLGGRFKDSAAFCSEFSTYAARLLGQGFIDTDAFTALMPGVLDALGGSAILQEHIGAYVTLFVEDPAFQAHRPAAEKAIELLGQLLSKRDLADDVATLLQAMCSDPGKRETLQAFERGRSGAESAPVHPGSAPPSAANRRVVQRRLDRLQVLLRRTYSDRNDPAHRNEVFSEMLYAARHIKLIGPGVLRFLAKHLAEKFDGEQLSAFRRSATDARDCKDISPDAYEQLMAGLPEGAQPAKQLPSLEELQQRITPENMAATLPRYGLYDDLFDLSPSLKEADINNQVERMAAAADYGGTSLVKWLGDFGNYAGTVCAQKKLSRERLVMMEGAVHVLGRHNMAPDAIEQFVMHAVFSTEPDPALAVNLMGLLGSALCMAKHPLRVHAMDCLRVECAQLKEGPPPITPELANAMEQAFRKDHVQHLLEKWQSTSFTPAQTPLVFEEVVYAAACPGAPDPATLCIWVQRLASPLKLLPHAALLEGIKQLLACVTREAGMQLITPQAYATIMRGLVIAMGGAEMRDDVAWHFQNAIFELHEEPAYFTQAMTVMGGPWPTSAPRHALEERTFITPLQERVRRTLQRPLDDLPADERYSEQMLAQMRQGLRVSSANPLLPLRYESPSSERFRVDKKPLAAPHEQPRDSEQDRFPLEPLPDDEIATEPAPEDADEDESLLDWQRAQAQLEQNMKAGVPKPDEVQPDE